MLSIRRERKLFGRWQQRCGLSLSVLQQLVQVAELLTVRAFQFAIRIDSIRFVMLIDSNRFVL